MTTYEWVQGATGDIDIFLLADGVAPAVPISGTPALVVQGADGTVVDTSGKVTTVDATAWKVRYNPGAADLLAAASPYQMRWMYTSGGKVFPFPNGEADLLIVRKP